MTAVKLKTTGIEVGIATREEFEEAVKRDPHLRESLKELGELEGKRLRETILVVARDTASGRVVGHVSRPLPFFGFFSKARLPPANVFVEEGYRRLWRTATTGAVAAIDGVSRARKVKIDAIAGTPEGRKLLEGLGLKPSKAAFAFFHYEKTEKLPERGREKRALEREALFRERPELGKIARAFQKALMERLPKRLQRTRR